MAGSKMIDLRSASLVDFLPESIASDPDILAITRAIDPETQEISSAIVEAVILARLNEQPETVLDAIAWSMHLHTLAAWSTATITGKRRFLAWILDLRRRSGTPYALRRSFDLMQVVATIVE